MFSSKGVSHVKYSKNGWKDQQRKAQSVSGEFDSQRGGIISGLPDDGLDNAPLAKWTLGD